MASQSPPGYALTVSEPERQRYRMMAERALANERDQWTSAGVVPGAHVVDLGCGPGAVLVQLALLVAPGGEVVGVEPDPSARSAAENEIATAGVAGARVVDGTATASGLPAGESDVVMVRHVLFHLGAGAPEAVAHAASLLRPGGSLYLVDSSADRNRVEGDVDPDAMELRQRYVEFQRARGCDVTVGSRLGRLLTDAGLEVMSETTYENVVPGHLIAPGGPMVAALPAMLAAGAATDEEVERWRAGIERTAATPGVSLYFAQLIAVGRRRAAS